MKCEIDGCFGECDTHNPPNITASWTTAALGLGQYGNLQHNSVAGLADLLDKTYMDWLNKPLEPNVMLVSPTQYAKIKEMFGQQSMTAGPPSITTFTQMTYMGMPVIADKYAPGLGIGTVDDDE